MEINNLVWLKQQDYNQETWTLGVIKGFTKKMIKCQDLARPFTTQEINKVGNFLPKNVRLLTKEELQKSYYQDQLKKIKGDVK